MDQERGRRRRRAGRRQGNHDGGGRRARRGGGSGRGHGVQPRRTTAGRDALEHRRAARGGGASQRTRARLDGRRGAERHGASRCVVFVGATVSARSRLVRSFVPQDVLKALALGASAVGVGKPVFFSLAVAGREGVERLLRLLRTELETAMALCGIERVEDATPDLVTRAPRCERAVRRSWRRRHGASETFRVVGSFGVAVRTWRGWMVGSSHSLLLLWTTGARGPRARRVPTYHATLVLDRAFSRWRVGPP